MTNAPTGPITLADVRHALADIDPNSTNAGALREIIGRGSYATIQKHLDAIRVSRAPVVPVAPGSTPPPPADAAAAIWGAAWAQAQMLTLGRLEAVTAERDSAQALVETLSKDISTLASEIDSKTAAFEVQTDALEKEIAQAASREKLINDSWSIAEQQRLKAEAEIEHVKAAAATAAAFSQRDSQISAAAMQAALDAQIQKYIDLKSVVDHLIPTQR